MKDVGGIPVAGKSLIVVAVVDHVLHFRVFAGDGKIALDTDEKKLTEKMRQIEDLRSRPEYPRRPPNELTKTEKARVIASIISIVGHAPPPETPPTQNGRMHRRHTAITEPN